MADFVLVAGAWLGAWAWDDVTPGLRAGGHGTFPLTPAGLAERRGEPAGQQTHVRDIVAGPRRPASNPSSTRPTSPATTPTRTGSRGSPPRPPASAVPATGSRSSTRAWSRT